MSDMTMADVFDMPDTMDIPVSDDPRWAMPVSDMFPVGPHEPPF